MKPISYSKKADPALDAEFAAALPFGKVRLGQTHLFFRKFLGWQMVEPANAVRIFRRVEEVNAKMCCGRANFDIDKLVFVDANGEFELIVAEGDPEEAQALFDALRRQFPQIAYGKAQ